MTENQLVEREIDDCHISYGASDRDGRATACHLQLLRRSHKLEGTRDPEPMLLLNTPCLLNVLFPFSFRC